MAIPLTTITIPTPQPYEKQNSERNRENYFYVWLQILQAAKDAGESVSLNPSTSLSVDLADLTAAVEDLAFTGGTIDLPMLGLAIQYTGKTRTITQP